MGLSELGSLSPYFPLQRIPYPTLSPFLLVLPFKLFTTVLKQSSVSNSGFFNLGVRLEDAAELARVVLLLLLLLVLFMWRLAALVREVLLLLLV